MVRLLALSLALALSSVACTIGPTASAAESLPPAPAAPAGWQSIGSFGTPSAIGWGGVQLAVSAAPLAIHVACSGNGDVVVAIGTGDGPRTSVVMGCRTVGDTAAEGRWLLPVPAAAATESFSAAVVEDPGSLRRAAYQISIEQPTR